MLLLEEDLEGRRRDIPDPAGEVCDRRFRPMAVSFSLTACAAAGNQGATGPLACRSSIDSTGESACRTLRARFVRAPHKT